MRECIVPTLILLAVSAASAQTVPAGWKTVKEAKGICQIAVPPEWALLDGSPGAALFQNVNTALAVVTAQPGQTFKPLAGILLKMVDVPKDKMFENTAKRIFYQDKVSKRPEDPNAFTANVPGTNGTCSCHVVALPSVSEDIVKKVVLSLAPVAEATGNPSDIR